MRISIWNSTAKYVTCPYSSKVCHHHNSFIINVVNNSLNHPDYTYPFWFLFTFLNTRKRIILTCHIKFL